MAEDEKDQQKPAEKATDTGTPSDGIGDPGSLEGDGNAEAIEAEKKAAEATVKEKKSFGEKLMSLTRGLNLYLLGFGVILIIAGFVIFIAVTSDNTDDGGLNIEGGELTQEAIDELIQSDTNIGDVQETLTVEANAIFNGKILVKDSLDVAGTINVGGALSLPGITVSGTSSFEDVNIDNNLSIAGNTNILGTLTVESNLSVTGDATIGGRLSANTLNVEQIQFTNDLEILRHVDTGGGTPTASAGTAIGGAGTVSLSGTDTAGTVTINTSGGAASGSLITITFTNAYSRTPHVQITPVGSTGASLQYYVSRSATSFTISTANAANGNTTYIFDYWVVE